MCPATNQATVAPLVCALLDQIRQHLVARQAFWPPMLWALDELANIAPLPNLPSVLAEAGGHGLLVLACLQDLSQARARWGNRADGFLTLFATTLLLPGVADPLSLRTVTTLAGQTDRPHESRTRTGFAIRQTTTSSRKEPVPPEHVVAHGRPGHALRLYRTYPSWLRLTPWHTTPGLARILDPERTSR